VDGNETEDIIRKSLIAFEIHTFFCCYCINSLQCSISICPGARAGFFYAQQYLNTTLATLQNALSLTRDSIITPEEFQKLSPSLEEDIFNLSGMLENMALTQYLK
jgi:hypothetical protein